MSKITIGVLAFAAGALSGVLFTRWYVMRHAGALAGEAIGDKLFGHDSTGSKILAGVLNTVDEVRA